ncbi:MAG: hypothetical protein ACK4RV_18145 [Caulobacter sp.]|jgi:hypothetical protein
MRHTLALAALLSGLALAAGSAGAQEAPEGGAWIDCQVTAITAFRDRMSVTCAAAAPREVTGSAGVREYMVETNDPLADLLTRLAIEAKGRARPLGLLLVRAPEANPAECPAETCRRVAGAMLK